jgi:acyl carrier protein
MPDLPSVSPEIMGSLKTLGQIAEFFVGSNDGELPEIRTAANIQDQHNLDKEKISDLPDNPQNKIVATMLEVVGQLTGYPVEMLGLDMDIEAELGIDSIKRVEILSALEEQMPELPAVSPEIMGTLKTLGQISEYLGNSSKTKAFPVKPEVARVTTPSTTFGQNPGASGKSAQALPDPDRLETHRNVIKVIKAPEVSAAPLKITGNKTVFVTEDNTGLSEKIADALVKLGINTTKIHLDELKSKHQLSEAAGLIIVQDPESRKMEQDLKDAFALAKQLAPNLLDAAKESAALFATVSRMDGAFGFKQTETIHPLQGGLAGLAKTAAIEWENVCCHAIDIAASHSDFSKIAPAVAKEILTPGPVEIGLDSEYRCTLTLESEPYPTGQLNLESDDVLVISGGARGITATAALALARHARPCLVLLGRSPNPVADPLWLSSLEDEALMKKAIIENEFMGKTPSPA